jgi:hypothetical protein
MLPVEVYHQANTRIPRFHTCRRVFISMKENSCVSKSHSAITPMLPVEVYKESRTTPGLN